MMNVISNSLLFKFLKWIVAHQESDNKAFINSASNIW